MKRTELLELPIYEADDLTSWLTTYNDSMGIIDAYAQEMQDWRVTVNAVAADASKTASEALGTARAAKDESERARVLANNSEKVVNTYNDRLTAAENNIAGLPTQDDIDQLRDSIAVVDREIRSVVTQSTTAVNQANSAVYEATEARREAHEAQNTANTASQNIDQALATANSAKNTADNALEVARGLQGDINNATAGANAARNAAEAATQKANEAIDAAEDATAAANNAVVEASEKAKEAVDAANSAIETAAGAAEAANNAAGRVEQAEKDIKQLQTDNIELHEHDTVIDAMLDETQKNIQQNTENITKAQTKADNAMTAALQRLIMNNPPLDSFKFTKGNMVNEMYYTLENSKINFTGNKGIYILTYETYISEATSGSSVAININATENNRKGILLNIGYDYTNLGTKIRISFIIYVLYYNNNIEICFSPSYFNGKTITIAIFDIINAIYIGA